MCGHSGLEPDASLAGELEMQIKCIMLFYSATLVTACSKLVFSPSYRRHLKCLSLVTSVPSRLNSYISYLVVRQRSFSMCAPYWV